MTDEEIVEAMIDAEGPWDTLEDFSKKAFEVARPLIRAQLIAELREPSEAMLKHGMENWRPIEEMAGADVWLRRGWQAMLDAFTAEQKGTGE